MFTATKDDNVAALKNNTQELRGTIDQTVTDAKEELRVAANGAGRTVRAFLDTASDELSVAKSTVESEIRSNPIRSSAIALGLGFVVGALFRR